MVYQLFDAGDHDHSGGIDREEFGIIIKVCCAQLTGRIISYWAILILLVPYLAQHVIHYFMIDTGTYLEMAAEQSISLVLFFLVIPLIWNRIDIAMHKTTTDATKKRKSATGIDLGGDEKRKDD